MKRLSLICLLMVMFVSLFSIDYGLSIDESVAYNKMTDTTLNTKASIWSNLNLGKSGRFEFKSNVVYKSSGQMDVPYFMDIDLLKFRWDFKRRYEEDPKTSLTIGRFPVADQTGRIFAHKVDGASLKFTFPGLSLTNGVYYSGLLWKSSSAIVPSKLDIYHSGIEHDTPFELGSPRVIGISNLSFKPVLSQRLSSEFVYQVDMRDQDVIEEYTNHDDEDLINSGGLLDSYYLSLKLAGVIPVIKAANYSLSYAYNGGRSLSTVDDNDYYSFSDISAHMVDMKVDKYFTNFYNSFVSYGFHYSTGDEDFIGYSEDNREGSSNMFVPVTRSGFAVAFSPSVGNIMSNSISGSIKLIEQLQTTIKGSLFHRTSTGPISEPGLSSESDELYLGTAVDLICNFRPLSDLGVTFVSGLYFPSDSVYHETYLEDNGSFLFSASLSLSFSI